MMRAFAVAAAEDETRLLDLILIDESTGEIAFGTGAVEDLFDQLAPLDADGGLDIDEVIARIDGWANDHLRIDEVETDTLADQATGDQVASLSGAARQHFNDLHDRGFGGKFARKGSGDKGAPHAPNAPNAPSAPGPRAVPSAPEKKPVQRAPRGAVDKAIASGQPDALADVKRPALLAAAKKRNLIIGSRMTDQELRDLLLDHAGVPAPKAPKTVAAALKAGDRDALAGMSKASLVAAVKKKGGLGLGDPGKLDQGELADALLDAQPEKLAPDAMVKKLKTAKSRDEAAAMLEGTTVTDLRKLADEMKMPYVKSSPKKRMHDDVINWAVGHDLDSKAIGRIAQQLFDKPRPQPVDHPETLETRELRNHARALGIDVSEIGHNKDELVNRINAVKAANATPRTSKMNAHSLSTGDRIVEDGKQFKIVGTRRNQLGGKQVVELTVVDADGRQKKIIKRMNEPVDRLSGAGRAGGGGTFAVNVELPDFAALDDDALFAWLAEQSADQMPTLAPVELPDQVAALEGAELADFIKKHPRGKGGRFGHSNLLFDVLRAKAAKAGDTSDPAAVYFDGAGSDNVEGSEFYTRSFDWTNRNRDITRRGDQEHIFDITGPMLIDEEYDDEGENVISQEHDEHTARFGMSDADMRNLANMIGTQLLRKRLQDEPFNIDDPRTPYIIAMMDMQPRISWTPEDAAYDGSINIFDHADGTWSVNATDDDGNDVSFMMSQDEIEALYGQLSAYLLTPAGREEEATPVPPAQTAAYEWQTWELDYAEDFATWAANEFDISTMPERLQRYWTEGPGAIKVKWKVRGAFKRCTRNLTKEGVPLHMVKGACANLYRRATGKYPGPHNRRGRSGPGRVNVMGLRVTVPAQTACASCGNDSMLVDLGDDYGPGDPGPDMSAPSTSTGWRGPLAPIDVATGDRRQFATLQALKSRRLPLPFRWQERQQSGHDGAVVVGALTGYNVLDAPYTMPNGSILPPGTIMGEGYFLDPAVIPEVGRAKYLVEHGLVGPSVDLEPDMDVEFADADGNTFDPHQCQADGSCPAKPKAMITDATVTGATLVPITAFAEVRAPELFDRTVGDDMAVSAMDRPSCGCGDQLAAVRANGWDDLPFADRETEWDKGAAVARLVDWATAEGDGGELDLGKYGQAFLWHDDPADTQGAFRLPIADVVDGQLTIVPRAVFAVAARLNQTDIPASAKQDIRNVLEDLYDQMSDEFDDEDLQAPWDGGSGDGAAPSNEMAADDQAADTAGCGCAEKWARALTPAGVPTGQVAAAVFAGMEPYPADAFRVKASALTPMTIDDRPDEPFTRVYGHIGSWSSCNRGHRGVCIPPPRSRSGYKEFHLGKLRTTEGDLPAGKIVMGEGHADVNGTPRVVRAFYDATSKEIAWGRMVDDEFGPFFSGVLAPGVTAQEAATFMMSPPSGHWTNFELMAILGVNVPGHAVPRAHVVAGQMANMVAAGRWYEPEELEAPVDDIGAVVADLQALAWADEAETMAAAFQ